MNGLSYIADTPSSQCECINLGGIDGVCAGSGGNRADGDLDCASDAYSYFEECDDNNTINGDGCNSVMQWEDDGSKRAYQAASIDDVLSMYDAIAAALPVTDAIIRFTGGFADLLGTSSLPLLDGTPVTITNFNDLDDEVEGRGAEDYPVPMSVGFTVEFTAEPDVELVFSNAEYDYCPW